MGHRFSLVLSREITAEESAVLLDSGCAGAVFSTDSLPTNADVTVTKLDFDDTISPSLAEAIESALEAVKIVPDLSVPGLTVPAQPAQASDAEPAAATIAEESAGKPVAKKTSAKKPAAKKAGVPEPAVATNATEAATVGAGRQ